MGDQPNDLDFGLNEDMEALDLGERNLSSHDIHHMLYEDDEEEHELNVFWTTTQCVVNSWCVCVRISEPFGYICI